MKNPEKLANLLGQISYEDWLNVRQQVDWLFQKKIIESKLSLDDSRFLLENFK